MKHVHAKLPAYPTHPAAPSVAGRTANGGGGGGGRTKSGGGGSGAGAVSSDLTNTAMDINKGDTAAQQRKGVYDGIATVFLFAWPLALSNLAANGTRLV